MPRSASGSTSAPARSPPTTTGDASTATTIGDGAFIGVDTMIVAPREIGEGARTGAGAVVTRDVPAGKLAVGVPARIREPRANRGRDRAAPMPTLRRRLGPQRTTRRRERRRLELGIIVVLVLLNGVFSATEIALVTIRRSRLQQLIDEGHRGARRVQRLKENPGRFLAVIQIGINFLGFLASAFAAVSLVDGMAAWLAHSGRSRDSPAGSRSSS